MKTKSRAQTRRSKSRAQQARSSLAGGAGNFYRMAQTRELENGRKITEIEVIERIGEDRCVLFRTVGAADWRTRKLVDSIVDFLNMKSSQPGT
jgi:hypothetical protein